jgi:hypothetical protein
MERSKRPCRLGLVSVRVRAPRPTLPNPPVPIYIAPPPAQLIIHPGVLGVRRPLEEAPEPVIIGRLVGRSPARARDTSPLDPIGFVQQAHEIGEPSAGRQPLRVN